MTSQGLGVIRRVREKDESEFPRIEVGADCLGLGKTTAVKVLAQRIKQLQVPVKSSFELGDLNPYLRLSYENPSKGLLKSQKWFIKTKYKQVKNGAKKAVFIQDVHPEMDYNYALTNMRIGRLSRADFKEYNRYFNSLNWDEVPAPDLLVYLHLDDKTLLSRTHAAAEEYEKVEDDYYLSMKQANREWVKEAEREMNVLRLNLSELAFNQDKVAQLQMMAKVLAALKKVNKDFRSKSSQLNGRLRKKDWDKIKQKKAIITCGLPGCGKSHFAREICDNLGYEHLASDKIRKTRAYKEKYGKENAQRYIKSDEVYEKTWNYHYQILMETAIDKLKAGKGVVIDATFLGPQRQKLLKTLKESGYLNDSLFLPVKADELAIMRQMMSIMKMNGEVKSLGESWAHAYSWHVTEVEEGRASYPDEEKDKVEVLPVANGKLDDLFSDQGMLPFSKLKQIEVKQIIILAGLPGCGKSYVARKVAKRLGFDYLSTDKIRHSKIYKNETNKFMSDVSKYEKSRELTYKMMHDLMLKKLKKGKSVILDGTYVGPQIETLTKLLLKEKVLDKAMVLLIKSPEEVIEKRINILKRRLTNGEEHAKAWRRSFNWFEEKLKLGEIRFPSQKKDGVKVMEIWNQ